MSKQLADLTSEDLVSVYNGKIGACCCGCSGVHTYMDAAEGAAARGYAVRPEEVNPAEVGRILRKIQTHAAQATIDDGRDQPLWWVELGRRWYIAYGKSQS
jgi:hypothetical protein